MSVTATLRWRDLRDLYCPEQERDAFDRCEWLQASPVPEHVGEICPTAFCDWLSRLYAIHASEAHRKSRGQFFTSPDIAQFMAGWSQPLPSGAYVLEPGAGTGILLAALAENQARQPGLRHLRALAYETEAALRPALALALGYVRAWLGERGIGFDFQIQADDFILANASRLRPAPLLDPGLDGPAPHLVISNPPYFKIPRTDPRAALLADVVHGQPNLYSLFMAAAARLVRPEGHLVFITPRSFCSGPYFRQFRKVFFREIALRRIHVFESRTEAFGRDEVLQENVIIAGQRTPAPPATVTVSTSQGALDLGGAQAHTLAFKDVLDLDTSQAILSIPTKPSDISLKGVFESWADRLRTMGVEVSTGPVVPFRTHALVTDVEQAAGTAPLVWVQHIRRMAVQWPLAGFAKPQRIRVETATYGLLLPNANYVLVRRFSPKEENSRLTAAPYLGGELPSDFLAVENHINYLHRPRGALTETETLGLAAFLNSRWVDQYFRIISGNTQVSATELRELPLPPPPAIHRIGERLRAAGPGGRVVLLNEVVGEELNLPPNALNGEGDHMPKIEEAKDFLTRLGLPPAQRNELAALTLLALGNLAEGDPWRKTQRRSLRIHDMLKFIEAQYRKRYAENTRETFRRQVLHQFEQARIVDRNPDDPGLPTNSPRTHYALSEAILPVAQAYGSKVGQRLLEKFKAEQGTLLDLYQKRRRHNLIALKSPAGREFLLSPGRHNQLQIQVVDEFRPRFAPTSKLLYLGDTADKTVFLDSRALQRLGFPLDKHGKLPDILLYSARQKRLFLVEVVTSHGPVSPKRYRELEALLTACPADRIYVSVFPDFKEYLRHAREIAWETEIWIAEAPDHLIHYNGQKFLRPAPALPKKSR